MLWLGNTIDSTALNALLDEAEGWMWDCPDAPLKDLSLKVQIRIFKLEYSFKSFIIFFLLKGFLCIIPFKNHDALMKD